MKILENKLVITQNKQTKKTSYMNSSFAYIPRNERKKILLICDDLRVHSGVATVAREMVLNTAQHFNWV